MTARPAGAPGAERPRPGGSRAGDRRWPAVGRGSGLGCGVGRLAEGVPPLARGARKERDRYPKGQDAGGVRDERTPWLGREAIEPVPASGRATKDSVLLLHLPPLQIPRPLSLPTGGRILLLTSVQKCAGLIFAFHALVALSLNQPFPLDI